MREFRSLVESHNWSDLFDSKKGRIENEITWSTHVYLNESSGTEYDRKENRDSKRADVVFLLPLLVLRGVEVKEPMAKEFAPYIWGRFPTTFRETESVRMSFKSEKLALSSPGVSPHMSLLELPLTDPVLMMAQRCGSLCLGVETEAGLEFTRVVRKPQPPVFPRRIGSIFNGKKSPDLKSIVKHAGKYELWLPLRPDSYLDREGGSSYEVYQSTRSCTSLPKVTNLGGVCFACGKQETSREHCSPKWLADSQGVEPLVAPILCKDCNGWFGKEIEAVVATYLSQTISRIDENQQSSIGVWAIKTALTMSIASGIRVDNNWLHQLRNMQISDRFTVYFDHTLTLCEPGFNYGVSRFSD